MKILIPTCKPVREIAAMVHAIGNAGGNCQITPSCIEGASASVNRNKCLDSLEVGEVAIMLDDDIEGFYTSWIDDLTAPLVDSHVVAVSARLLNSDGTFGPTCSRCYDDSPEEIEVRSNGQCIIPTAAIAFRWRGHRFDCAFAGSGWEDNDWFFQVLADDPQAKFIQSNRCKLIHRNEQKQQHGSNWKHNQAYFFTKWHGRRKAVANA